MSSRRPLFRRIATVFLTVLVCGTFIVSPLTVPTARAIPVEILADAPSQLTTILDTIFTQLVRAGTVALFNAAQTFLGQVAYDAANYVASGGKGQSPLTQAKSPGDYFSQIGEDALGSAIGSLSDDFFESNIGFDLCKPSVDKLLNLQLSLGNFLPSVNPAFTRPKPNCSFKEIVANYNQFYTTLTSKELLSNINASFNTNASDVGAALQIFGRTAAKVSTETGKKKADRAEDGAFKGITDVVSGDVKTPAGLIKEQTSESLIGGPNISESGKRQAILSSAADQGFVQLAMYTASMFVNTLGSKLMSRIMEKGLIDAFDFSDLEKQAGSIGGGGTTVATANPDAIPSRGRADARRANLALRDVNLIRQSNIEITAELIACPDVRGTWNCVMDQQLAQAVRGNACDNGSCTIVKALDRDLLKGEWKLFPDSMVRQNQDRNCYNQAYCAGNLRKLRLMRIVPVGLEFAANSDANIERCASAAGCVSLKEVVDNFTNCSAAGERDATHPWCKLVDPSWVLASFEQQCRLTGFGDQLLSDRLAQRKEECSDIQTCLKRNDKGECVGGFGYCVAEKTVYRFKADECSAQAASCRNFTTRANTSVSYLRNTLDYGVCSADNVGCLGYATLRRPDGSWINAVSSTTYFDQTLKSCGASDEGCTRLLAAEVGGSSLNLLTNASFERTSGAPVLPVSWSLVSGSFVSTPLPAGSTAVNGTQALVLRSGDEYVQRVAATPGTLMTVSVFARAVAGGDLPVVGVAINQFSNDTFSDVARIIGAYSGAGALFKSTVCTANPEPQAGGTGYGTDWRRFECSFLTSSRTRFIELSLVGKNTFIDAVQLEEGQFATNYTDGANNALPVVYMKVASDDFQCTGGPDDPASCGGFARVCRQVDAGCQGYTDGTPAPEIPAILSSNDLCPAECVGYAEYRKQGASFDLVVDADTRFSDPSDDGKANFIPATATQCSQQDVGCEVFTNLEAAAAGGEQTAAYSYLRLCEKPSANSQTYFTWEGSETTGYQLRTWALVGERRDVDGIYAPKIVPRRGPDGTFKDPATCDEGMWRTGLDADCRQYYDRAGLVFYAFFSQTVLSSMECKPLRISGRVNTNDCSLTGGSFNVSTGECSYNAMPSESLSCNVQLAGCRAYAGAGAGGGFLSVNENFRSGPGSFTSDSGAAPSPSPESLLVGDQSLRLQGASYTTRVSFASASGDLFRVSFWAKGVGAGSRLTLQVSDIRPLVGGATPVAVGQANLSGDWQRFSFGLFGGFAGAPTSSLSWTLTGSGTPVAFLDEVRVERVRDTAYVVKDSWNTPIACDQTFSGIPEPQAMLGCRQYTDRFQNKINASRFTRLCRQEAIGCRAFVDTRNSDSSEAQNFVSSDATPVARRTLTATDVPTVADFFPSTTTTRPADRMRYLVYETSKLCQSENMSCRAFGKPVYSTDRSTIESFETMYVKDDITAYSQAMCRPSEEFCEEFSYQSAKDYFKDPGDKSCEYKEGVRMSAADVAGLADGTYSGWFRKGGNSPCYPANLQGGNFFGLPKRGDESYAGWVGLCLPENGECTEFRDPNDVSDPQFRSGRPYYFVDNTKLDKTTCSGNADQGSGCILLRNQSNPTLDSSSLATDLSYRANNFRAVLPINCTEDPSNEFCQGRCRGTKTVVAGVGRPAVVTPYVGAVCSATEPCVTPTEAGTTFAISCITPQNDANVLVKVSTDRDCSQWLGCQSAETVFDPVTSQYKDVCTNLALCNKTTDTPGDIFCANYVDRNNATVEPVMTQGKYFDIANYSSRQTGLGTNDYSGYAIPDSFQIPDTLVARVGVDGAKTITENENRFANDYRLAAVARIPVNLSGRPAAEDLLPRTLGPNYAVNEARVLEGAGIGAANPGLFLCQHVGSGIIGYYRKDDRDAATSPTASKAFFNCYLPLRQDSDSYNFQNLVGTFGLDDPRVDPVLAKAFPAPECRANPEADSPFGTKYVTGWDLSTNPPKAILKINGYTNANVCAYGEDCSCSYKRAEYEIPTLTRFYSPLSGQVSPGVCSGGPRDGQSCLPTSVLSVGVGSAALQGGIAAANAQQLCGTPEQGGRCIASTKIEVIRGIFGQCLERDSTRILGDDRAANPCLTWNPNPILFGEKDPFHFQPTSGYLPPQNSGQYYCTSPSGEPVAVKMDKDSFATFSGSTDPASSYYAGLMKKIDYSGIILQSTSADTGPSLIAADPSSRYPTAIACTEADIPTSRPGGTRVVERYPTALRLVDAGSGYSETFFRINDQDVASGLGATVAIEYDRFLSDNTIGYLRASPAQGIGGGLLACGYQAGWVDTISSVDYTSAESMRQAERQFRDEFSRSYVSYMTRGSEKVLSVGALGEERAVKMPCLDVGGAVRGTDCYFKYWETGFQAQGQRQFDGIFAPNSDNVARSLDSLRRNPVISSRCESGKPYFAIRSMFQSRAENTEGGTAVDAGKVQGPWRFVGFWVSACAGNAGSDQRYIYMDLEVGGTNVCTELAEVQSINSRQDAAFTDRVWSQGGFREQNIGTTYSDAAAPFSSAINTGPAGKQPLFQDGQELTGFSPLNPPTFLRSGITTYYKSAQYPRDKWAYLTNIFARIYRVYQFNFYPVNRGDAACLAGPFKGAKCTTPDTTTEDTACKIDGSCLPSLMSSAERDSMRVCNRGVSAGLACSTNEECQGPSFAGTDSRLHTLQAGCLLRTDGPSWLQYSSGSITDENALFYSPDVEGGRYKTRQEAAALHAFACSTLSGRANLDCSAPTGILGEDEGKSPECPALLIAGTCSSPGTGLGVCNFSATPESDFIEAGLPGRPIVACLNNSYCNFTRADFAAASCGPAKDQADNDGTIIGTRLGRCGGGLRSGQVCLTRADAAGAPLSCNTSYGTAADEDAIDSSCGPVDSLAPNFDPVDACQVQNTSGPNTSTDPDNDTNLCTHSAGYQPRQDLCPNPSDEYCGLIAYDISTASAGTGSSVDPAQRFPLPTDVTLGHYTPTFLGFSSLNAAAFNYITYYTPRPPRLAAPDTRNCAVPGQCPISRLDAISLDGLADGSVMGGGGQHKSNLRFYAWAAHEQMPLRKVTIDWGDDKTQIIDDTRLKNRKPFCGVQKECKLVAGLTCQIDSDCPPGAGTCVSVGTCEKTQQRSCNADADCTVGGVKDTCNIRTMFGNASEACQQDYFDFAHVYTCGATEARSLPSCTASVGGGAYIPAGQCYFGAVDGFLMGGDALGGVRPTCSTTDPAVAGRADCLAAYRAIPGTSPTAVLPTGSNCSAPVASASLVTTRCSRDPARACSSASDCAAGDTCIDSLAPPSGCFDAASNSCRFTPRVMVQDNWGWCSGECRSTLVGGNLEDGTGPSVKVKHPFGGCYTGNVFNGTPEERVRFNSRSTQYDPGASPQNLYPTGSITGDDKAGECKPEQTTLGAPDTHRPWIVYPGSLQLRRSDEIAR